MKGVPFVNRKYRKELLSLRKHPFLLALRETSPAAKSEEKRMFSQAKGSWKGVPYMSKMAKTGKSLNFGEGPPRN